MNATRLIVQLVIYYLVIVLGMWALLTIVPELRGYLPVGGAEALIKGASKSATLEAAQTAASVKNLGASLGWMGVAILGALVTALPVSWVYMATRTSEEYDHSLSFRPDPPGGGHLDRDRRSGSLALPSLWSDGRGGALQNSLKSSGDALYILLSVGIGLASGIGAVELAFVMSLAFNLCFVILWITEYGEREGMKRYMTDFDPNNGPASAAPPIAGSPVLPIESAPDPTLKPPTV